MATLLLVRRARFSSIDAFQIESQLPDNWREHIALDEPSPRGHFRDPYPAPTWTIRPSELAALAYPLPVTVPRTPPPSAGPSSTGRRDEKDKATVKSPPSGSVKVEPSGNATSSIKSEEQGEGCTPTTYTCAYSTTAYEPNQALRDEIARLNSSGLQGGYF